MKKTITVTKIEYTEKKVSPKTGNQFWFVKLTDTAGDVYTAPNWIVNRQLVEGIQYDVEYEIKNNPPYKNLTVTRLVEHRNEIVVQSPSRTVNAPHNAIPSDLEAVLKDIQSKVTKILEMLEFEKLEQ